MKKKSALIFDCDGVMFDSRQANVNYYNALLAHYGLPPLTNEQVPFIHMNTADESVRYILQGTPYLEDALDYRLQMDYRPFIKDMVMEPGLKELLRRLKARAGLAVATNRSNTIGEVLDFNGLTGYFDIVVSSLDVYKPKPHPESLFKILDFFFLAPEQALYVGDSIIDYETARAAGVPFIAYKNKELSAEHHIDRLLDIDNLVG